jgi:hypothetical protein
MKVNNDRITVETEVAEVVKTAIAVVEEVEDAVVKAIQEEEVEEVGHRLRFARHHF